MCDGQLELPNFSLCATLESVTILGDKGMELMSFEHQHETKRGNSTLDLTALTLLKWRLKLHIIFNTHWKLPDR